MQWGMQYTEGMQYPVGMQYAVGVSAKRSTHTVDLTNMGGGDRYLYCKKVKPMQWVTQYAVGMRYTVDAKKVNSHSVLFAPTPTAYCIPYCVGFDLFALKVMVPTTHIC